MGCISPAWLAALGHADTVTPASLNQYSFQDESQRPKKQKASWISCLLPQPKRCSCPRCQERGLCGMPGQGEPLPHQQKQRCLVECPSTLFQRCNLQHSNKFAWDDIRDTLPWLHGLLLPETMGFGGTATSSAKQVQASRSRNAVAGLLTARWCKFRSEDCIPKQV